MAQSLSVNPSPKLMLSGLLLGGLLGLTACQQPSDNQDKANSEAAEATNSAQMSDPTSLDKDSNEAQPVERLEEEILEVETDSNKTDSTQPSQIKEPTETENSASNEDTESTTTKNTPPASEIQVTDVEYQDSEGRSIHVTFQTSATATLQASLRLPSGKRILLTAPTGQGNNPTYRSTDGSIELVTHGGGSSMDLFYENQRAEFDAVKTDSEILKPQ
ncbi:MAG TPA: hypothetical protein K8V12_05975 [Psychrobacter pasteurii]|nr:hypothetical protein [Psychrobacter pasteurii]